MSARTATQLVLDVAFTSHDLQSTVEHPHKNAHTQTHRNAFRRVPPDRTAGHPAHSIRFLSPISDYRCFVVDDVES